MKTTKKHPLMWKITHPDSGTVSYVFANYARLPEKDVKILTYKVTNSSAFNEVDLHISQTPPPKPSRIHFFSRPMSPEPRTVGEALWRAAKDSQKNIVPLTTRGYAKRKNRNVLTHTLIQPKNIAFGGLVFLVPPVGIPVAATCLHYVSKEDLRNYKESVYFIRNEDLTLVLPRLREDHPLHYKYNVKPTNYRWVYQGNDGRDNVETKEGLASLLTHTSAFITVGAQHVFAEDGLLALLTKEGFECTPADDWKKVKVPAEYLATEPESEPEQEGPSEQRVA